METKDIVNIIMAISLIFIFVICLYIYNDAKNIYEKQVDIQAGILELNKERPLDFELLQNTCLENGYESFKKEYSTNKYVLCNPPIWTNSEEYNQKAFYKVIKIKN